MVSLLRTAEKQYYSGKLDLVKGNMKKTWAVLNEIMGKKRDHKSIQELHVDNNIISDQQQIANKFNDFFINVGPNLAKKIPGSNKSVSDYQKKSYNNSIFLAPTSVNEILNIIQDLKISSNSDQNEIPVIILN